MGAAVEYQKIVSEIVYINLPGPEEPMPGMTGGELLHGFLADIYKMPDKEMRNTISALCGKWNVHYRNNGG